MLETRLKGKYFSVFQTNLFLLTSATASSFDEVNVVFFHGEKLSEFQIFSLTSLDQVASHSSYNQRHPTALYIHGYRENITSESVQTIVKAFSVRKTHNILVLDWSAYADGNYVTNAVPNVIKEGWWGKRCFR